MLHWWYSTTYGFETGVKTHEGICWKVKNKGQRKGTLEIPVYIILFWKYVGSVCVGAGGLVIIFSQMPLSSHVEWLAGHSGGSFEIGTLGYSSGGGGGGLGVWG
jgi:hypothetical protein